jgi:Asp/Glu/Hydantoin racemase
MSIESLDLNRALSYLGEAHNEESWSQFDDYHRMALKRLEASGAEVALIASNTPHHRFKAIVQGIQIPVINIFETAARESARIRASHVLILGTALTMDSPEFRQEFAKWDIKAAGPDDGTARSRTAELIGELQQGRFEGAANRLAAIARVSIERRFQGRARSLPGMHRAAPGISRVQTPLRIRLRRHALYQHHRGTHQCCPRSGRTNNQVPDGFCLNHCAYAFRVTEELANGGHLKCHERSVDGREK